MSAKLKLFADRKLHPTLRNFVVWNWTQQHLQIIDIKKIEILENRKNL